MVNNQGLILHKTGHENGKKNGYGFYKHNQPVTASQVESVVVVVVDLGYLRVQKDFPTVKCIVLPYRKKRKSEPSLEERRYNKKHVKLRIVVEHIICRIKKFGIIGSKFRKRLQRYDVISSIVSVLINFRIMRSNGMRV
jgi:hypothetical protein